MMPCSLVNVYQHFGGVCCLYVKGIRFMYAYVSHTRAYVTVCLIWQPARDCLFYIGGVHIFAAHSQISKS
jgi:hypothetical protein